MGVNEIFGFLEIEVTKDENVIKQAYRKKLAVTNPEDNPEGFKYLRQAYEAAVAYARKPDDEENEQEEADNTPSGLWVKKAEVLYNDITLRRDVNKWRELFDDEVFLSLEGEALCREKLLVFIMDNYRFPTAVWELFDEKMKISDSVVELKEKFPGDFINFVADKCVNGEDFNFDLFEGAADASYDEFLSVYYKCWEGVREGNYELVSELVKTSGTMGIYHPFIEILQCRVYTEKEDYIEAEKHLEPVYEKFPKEIGIANAYGQACWAADKKDMAADVFKKIKEEIEDHYMANYYLAQWYNENEDYENAKLCGKIVMSNGAGDEFADMMLHVNEKLMESYKDKYLSEGDIDAGIEYAGCQLQNCAFYAGIKWSEQMFISIPAKDKARYYAMVCRLYIEGAYYEKALEAGLLWREAIKERLPELEGEEIQEA